MRFLIDESADARLAAYLISQGREATLVARDYEPGLPDSRVLAIARDEGRILITDDSDFGERIFRLGEPHQGVLYFRLRNTLFATRVRRLEEVLERHADHLHEFIVVTDRRERVRR